MFAKWEDKAVWKPFLRPTVNINHFMTDGASPTARRTIIPRTAHARLDIRVTPDTPPAAMVEIVERVRGRRTATARPGITFTVKTAGQPASYTSPTRPEFGWLLRLLEQHGDAEPVALPTLGGTLPLWVFTETLGIPAPVDSRRQQRQPAARRQRALRAAHFFAQTALYADIVASRPLKRRASTRPPYPPDLRAPRLRRGTSRPAAAFGQPPGVGSCSGQARLNSAAARHEPRTQYQRQPQTTAKMPGGEHQRQHEQRAVPAERQPEVQQERAHAQQRVQQDQGEQRGLHAAPERVDQMERDHD